MAEKTQAISEDDESNLIDLAERLRHGETFTKMMETISPEMLEFYKKAQSSGERAAIIRQMLKRE